MYKLVITGPTANATVFGSKPLNCNVYNPISNSSGSITVGTTGAGITTTGVTGSATLNSVAMASDATNKTFTITTEMPGLKLSIPV